MKINLSPERACPFIYDELPCFTMQNGSFLFKSLNQKEQTVLSNNNLWSIRYETLPRTLSPKTQQKNLKTSFNDSFLKSNMFNSRMFNSRSSDLSAKNMLGVSSGCLDSPTSTFNSNHYVIKTSQLNSFSKFGNDYLPRITSKNENFV